jgi:hypothetical protein
VLDQGWQAGERLEDVVGGAAATVPGSGRHDTVSTPSMSISTAPTRMP